MKIIKKKIVQISCTVISALLLFNSCASKQADNDKAVSVRTPITTDSAGDDNNDSEVILDDKITKSEGNDVSDSIKKDNENFLQKIFDGESKYKEIDYFTLSTATVSAKIKEQEAILMIDDKEGTAGFGSQIMSAYYILLMDQKSRNVFISAVNAYHSDFANKKLERKGKQIYKKYGSSDVTLHWGLVRSSTTNYAYATNYFGYEFKDGSPYFTITINPTLNQRRLTDDIASETSMSLKYYFTKAQSRLLADFLSDDNINNYLFTNNTPELINYSDEY